MNIAVRITILIIIIIAFINPLVSQIVNVLISIVMIYALLTGMTYQFDKYKDVEDYRFKLTIPRLLPQFRLNKKSK